MLKVLLVDDETLARQRLQRQLQKLEIPVQVVGEADNGQRALELAESEAPDVVLLDINMPGTDGLQVAAELARQKIPPAVIFVTAYDQHSLAAFDAEALAYLLKPVSVDDLHRALCRVIKPTRAQIAELVHRDGRKHISYKSHHGVELIPVADIVLLQAEDKYVTAYYPGGEALLDQSLVQLEKEFEERFVRVHRNALVARDAIRGLERKDDHNLVVLQGISIKPMISRRLEAKIRKLVQQL